MIDLNLLKETLKSRGYTQEKMAKSLGITTYTLNRKLLGVFDFKGREMNQIAAMMKLSRKEICDIFLLTSVHEMHRRQAIMGGRGSGRPKGSLNTKKRMRRESCMVDLEQLRQDLKAMIDLSDLTMDEFAEALGITERTLYTYLAHPGQMRVSTLKNIEYLAGRKGETT